jgi:hypothetical protein
MPRKIKIKKKKRVRNCDRDKSLDSDDNNFDIHISKSHLPPIDLVVRCYLNHYLKKLKRHMLPESRWKYLVMTVEVLHFLIGSGAFTLGLLLPPTYIPFNILLVSVVIIGWQLLGYCFITKLISKLTGETDGFTGDLTTTAQGQSNRFLIPFSETILKLYGALVIMLSLFFYLKPEWSPYNMIKSLIVFIFTSLIHFIKRC